MYLTYYHFYSSKNHLYSKPTKGLQGYGLEYRFHFNGMERDNETYGEGNSYDYGDRFYNPRLGRWLTVDPLRKIYTSLSPYSFAGNSPIVILDADGNILKDKNGNIIVTSTGTYTGGSMPISQTENLDGTTTTTSLINKYEKVNIYADDGTPIEALRLVESYVEISNYDSKGNLLTSQKDDPSKHGLEAKSDCHGYTFTGGKLWIDDDKVNYLLDHDNYIRNSAKSKADAVIFKKGGKVVHSADKNASGTYDNDAGVLTLEKNKTLAEASRGLTDVTNKNNVEFVDKKGSDKVVNANSGKVEGGLRYMKTNEVQSLVNPPSSVSTAAPPVKINFSIKPMSMNKLYVAPKAIMRKR